MKYTLSRITIPYLACFFASLLIVRSAPAQNDYNFFIDHITTEQGLSSNNINRILQDDQGFIWIITSAGLDRYDGYTFRFYGYNAKDSNSISSGWFDGAMDKKHGIIWISGNGNQGFYSFNMVTEKFTHFKNQPGNPNSLPGGDLNGNLIMDRHGIIWIATVNGLDAFDPDTKTFKSYTHNKNDPASIQSNNIITIEQDEENHLWLIMNENDRDAIDCFDPQTGKVTAHINGDGSFLPANTDHHVEYNLRAGTHGNVWIASEDQGLYGYNIRTKKSIHFNHDAANPYSISKGINAVLEDQHGRLWISTNQHILDYYDSSTGRFYHSVFNNHINEGNDAVKQIFQDRGGRIWIATADDGIYSFSPRKNPFQFINDDPGLKNRLPSNNSICILQSRAGQILLGTDRGMIVFDQKTGAITPYPIFEKGKDISGALGYIWCIYEDREGILWLCTFNGLLSLEYKTGKHRWYKHSDADTSSLSAPSCTGILQDSKGRYWVTVWTGGLASFDPVKGSFHTFRMHEGSNSISTNYVANLVEGRNGMIYIGSWDGGFITFNPDKETFKIYRHEPLDSFSVSSDIVFDCYPAKNGIVWLATNGGGLNAFDPVTEKFKAFSTDDGLCSNGIISIEADNEGRLWLGTLHGISCFTPPENPFSAGCIMHFRNYDMSDGLPSNQIALSSAYKTNDGTMYFGTVNKGFFYFHPEELKDNSFIPPVYITGFDLFNHPVQANRGSRILPEQIENAKRIELSYDQNVVSFSFAALNYDHPEKNRYAYKLEGFDKDWTVTDAGRRFANYTNLNAGEYLFKVKGSNNDGVWNDKPAMIRLVVSPPFHKTWWFRVLMGIAITGIIYTVYAYRVRELTRLQLLRNNIASDLHDEIGSTLNSISILSSVAKQQAGQSLPALDQIGENSRKVVESMNDIVWTINPENDNFEKILVRMRSFVHQVMKGKEIEYQFEADDHLQVLSLPMVTRKNFYLIFKEATINMAKYSSATQAWFTVTEQDQQLQLKIRDNGKGFDTRDPSPGNGIRNMQRRAAEIRAVWKMESVPGEGTHIALTLKI